MRFEAMRYAADTVKAPPFRLSIRRLLSALSRPFRFEVVAERCRGARQATVAERAPARHYRFYQLIIAPMPACE